MIVLALRRGPTVDLARVTGDSPSGGHFRRLQERLDEAGLSVDAGEFVRGSIAAGLILALLSQLVLGFPALSLVAFAGGWALQWAWLEARRDQRTKQQRMALAEAADLLRENYTILPSVPVVFNLLATNGPRELREDFRTMSSALSAGASLEEVLRTWQQGSSEPYIQQIAETLLVHDREGGHIGPILRRMADSVREQVRIQRRIEAEQTRQRWTGRIIALFPFAAILFLKIAAPDYVDPYYSSALGQVTILAITVLSSTGYWLMIRLAKRGIELGRVRAR